MICGKKIFCGPAKNTLSGTGRRASGGELLLYTLCTAAYVLRFVVILETIALETTIIADTE